MSLFYFGCGFIDKEEHVMEPMGFWESILFTVMMVIFYCVVGFMVSIYPGFEDEDNFVKRIGIVLVWPIVSVVAILKGLKWLSIRLVADARRLRPKVQPKAAPNAVTVAMLAAERGTAYEPGSWAS